MKIPVFLLLGFGALVFSCKKKVSLTEDPGDFTYCTLKESPQSVANNKNASSRMADLSEQFVIYLDFDGETCNYIEFTGTTTPFTAQPSALGTGIYGVLAEVQEAYSPFQVTVTLDVNVYLAASNGRRSRCIIGRGLTPTLGYTGGVSFVGTALWTPDLPCFVLEDNLGTNVRNVALAVAHEVGHTLGLHHQSDYNTSCTQLNLYHPGIGNASGVYESWGPIMGAPYNSAIRTWSWGATEYGCNSIENNFSIITTNVPYKVDVDPNSIPANQLTPGYRAITAGTSSIIYGVLEQPGDFDVIRFTTPPSSRSFSLQMTNADAQVDLYLKNSPIASSYSYVATYNATNNCSIINQAFTIPVGKIGGLFVIRGAAASPYAPNTPANNPTYSPGWKKMLGNWSLSYQ